MMLDTIDKKIITLLQQNARIPLKAIAEATYLSSPAVSARISRLETAGIITNYTARIDLLSLGLHIKAFINVEVSPEQKAKFYPFIEGVFNVLECNCITGDFSMLLKVVFASTIDLDIFINKLQKFGKTNTQIVFSTPVGPRSIKME